MSATYESRRGQIEHYFDRTAAQTWARLTSDAPVSGVRATVRAGRDEMRRTLLSWLPDNLKGLRILDAGCGTGALAVEAASRGAEVVAIDLAANLVDVARQRMPTDLRGSIDFRVGDMLDPALGRFDHVVGMDSVIHYQQEDKLRVIAGLAGRTKRSILFTFPPNNAFLAVFMMAGKLFPRGDRAPAIEPVAEARLRRMIEAEPALARWGVARTRKIASGFYTSQAMELLAR
jgi:magnesium-protoporphyrin O-methyltransferase